MQQSLYCISAKYPDHIEIIMEFLKHYYYVQKADKQPCVSLHCLGLLIANEVLKQLENRLRLAYKNSFFPYAIEAFEYTPGNILIISFRPVGLYEMVNR